MNNAKAIKEARKCMEQARRSLSLEHGEWTPPRRRTWTYETDCSDGPITVHLHGETLANGPVAEYIGPLGHFAANINPKSIGRTWEVWKG